MRPVPDTILTKQGGILWKVWFLTTKKIFQIFRTFTTFQSGKFFLDQTVCEFCMTFMDRLWFFPVIAWFWLGIRAARRFP